MKIEFEGRTWDIDESEIGLQQAVVITGYLGVSLQGWSEACLNPDGPLWLKSMQCLYWLMLQQDGQHVPLADVDFAVMRFAEAWADATLAVAKAAAASAAEPDPTSSAAANGAAVPLPAVPAG